MRSPPEAAPPTLAEARARLRAVRPDDYARTRNHLDGAVTMLSPYITHGFVDLPAVVAGIDAAPPLEPGHRLMLEFGWREFFRHVWHHNGDAIFASLRPGPLPESAYRADLPADVREARTGIAAIDLAVRTLYATGTLHNHARMWLASYVVHLRRVHWRAGADWLYTHLLDGDLASNHLSWQWVAGTFSHKPYLFNADNVERFAPAPWHSRGTAIDTSYESLEATARGGPLPPTSELAADAGVIEPARHAGPPASCRIEAASGAAVTGRDVWLVHAWALRDPPPSLAADALCVSIWPRKFHEKWPWTDQRRAFVGTRMNELAPVCWHDSAAAIAAALQGARSVRSVDDPHLEACIRQTITQDEAQRLFGEVERPCASFSQWWKQVGPSKRGRGFGR